jgi:hypothetical protein
MQKDKVEGWHMTKRGRPNKPASKLAASTRPGCRRLTISLPEATIAAIDLRANKNRRCRTAEIELMLEMLMVGERPT